MQWLETGVEMDLQPGEGHLCPLTLSHRQTARTESQGRQGETRKAEVKARAVAVTSLPFTFKEKYEQNISQNSFYGWESVQNKCGLILKWQPVQVKYIHISDRFINNFADEVLHLSINWHKTRHWRKIQICKSIRETCRVIRELILSAKNPGLSVKSKKNRENNCWMCR